ncbi:hypothetical protein KR093_010416 [Drosophila rubida]|uniref:Transforming acidic coiled-coil-containing protein C-terminal domain-containing protein n=1 Tax=Drosophila rubida TaxID=30044 RepID=A0AAD4JUP5_9MUSC|nr:hypothetical protein KR093_010416 [Drosophila rubida]
MDFLSNLIKRPNSILLPVPEADSRTTNLAGAEATSSPPQVALTMDRCSIDAELETLFDSATKDLNCLEEQHNILIDVIEREPEALSSPSSPRETIQQLLSDINVNLDQVSAHEMEHLQAMSLELSPLAVKTGPRHSMEQQKALAAAAVMRSTSQPGTPTVPPVSGDPFRQQDLEPGIVKFTGLPEFDETQIPELPPLSAEIEAERDYNSDSDVFAECLSMNSVKMSSDPSELEAYSSALNEVLENQLSNVTGTALETTMSSQQTTAAVGHDDSCEPMDVDEITETMDILKHVLSPEDQQFLQQQFQSPAVQTARASDVESQLDKVLKQQLHGEEQQVEQLEKENQLQQLDIEQELKALLKPEEPLLERLEDQLQEKQTDELTENPLLANDEPLLQQHEDQLVLQELDTQQQQNDKPKVDDEQQPQESAQMTVADPSSPIVSSSPNPILTAGTFSPPIPTHRIKTADELQEQLILQQFDQPPEQAQPTTEQPETQVAKKLESALDAIETQPVVGSENDLPAEEAALPVSDLKPLQLNMIDSSQELSPTPISPTFPIKDPEIPCHFPRSPHAPPECEEMPYLEQAVIEPSLEQKLHLSGVIARVPLPIQVTLTQPSPEKPQQLSTTICMDSGSPLNGTFEGTHADADPIASPTTFGVLLGEATSHQRHTFSLNANAAPEEQPLNATIDVNAEFNDTYALPLNAVKSHQRQTFTLADLQPEQTCEEEQDTSTSPSTVQVEPPASRLTFSLEKNASPAMEATEENIMRNDFEPMEVDISLRAEPAFVPASLSPPIPTHRKKPNVASEEPREDLRETHSPPIPTHCPKESQPQDLKRPSIHTAASTSQLTPSSPNATVLLEEQKLSAKEQLSASDEKEDVFVEHFGAMSPISDDIFKAPQYSSSSFSKFAKGRSGEAAASGCNKEQFGDTEFQDGASDNNIIFNSSDFDYLYTKGSNNAPIDRSSLLLKFDPLLGAPVPVNQSQLQQEQTLLNILSNNNNLARALSPTLEEHETSGSNQSFVIEPSAKISAKAEGAGTQRDSQIKPPVDRSKKHAKMSVDVIDNDCNKTFDNSNLNSEDKTHKYNNMDELEKKIKNEVTRSEDIEKKLKDAEQREEALVKRITDKDKTNTKLNGVIEAYEKAIAELIHDKEQLVQNHEREMLEVQTDRDSNYHHLTSLETTFSDLHVKYEKSKEMTSHLKQIEENLLDEKKKLQEKLRQQEQRYEQMKSHAMQQMEIANKKLATISKEHSDEVKKLKALLKKEEVSRISTAEQLQQKSRENADLLKICEELIYDKGQGGSS